MKKKHFNKSRPLRVGDWFVLGKGRWRREGYIYAVRRYLTIGALSERAAAGLTFYFLSWSLLCSSMCVLRVDGLHRSTVY